MTEDNQEPKEVTKKARKIEEFALRICESPEEAVGALAITQYLFTRSASQYEVLQGSHLGSGKNE